MGLRSRRRPTKSEPLSALQLQGQAKNGAGFILRQVFEIRFYGGERSQCLVRVLRYCNCMSLFKKLLQVEEYLL